MGQKRGGACWGACCLPTAVCTEQGQPRAPASDSPTGSSYPDRRQKMPGPANSCLRPKRLSGGVRVNLLLWLFLLALVPWALNPTALWPAPLPSQGHQQPEVVWLPTKSHLLATPTTDEQEGKHQVCFESSSVATPVMQQGNHPARAHTTARAGQQRRELLGPLLPSAQPRERALSLTPPALSPGRAKVQTSRSPAPSCPATQGWRSPRPGK